jgi:predicted nucleic acid-binding protein
VKGYLVDSDVLIWHLRANQKAIDWLARLATKGTLAISAISVLEVQVGVKASEEEKTAAFLNGLACYPVDRDVARQAGEYIRAYRSRGITLDAADSLIAATAVQQDLVLITRNTPHYPMLVGNQLLSDWDGE